MSQDIISATFNLSSKLDPLRFKREIRLHLSMRKEQRICSHLPVCFLPTNHLHLPHMQNTFNCFQGHQNSHPISALAWSLGFHHVDKSLWCSSWGQSLLIWRLWNEDTSYLSPPHPHIQWWYRDGDCNHTTIPKGEERIKGLLYSWVHNSYKTQADLYQQSPCCEAISYFEILVERD